MNPSIGGLTITNPLQLSNTSVNHSTSTAPSNTPGLTYLNTSPTANLGAGLTGLNVSNASSTTPSTTSSTTPSPTTTTSSVTPSSTTTSGVLSPAMIAATQASITNDQQQNQSQYNYAAGKNAQNDQQQKLDYQAQEQNNTGNRGVAVQNAEQAAATGYQGLRAVLASLGALQGTGQVLAGRAVANSANTNIGTANQTYTTNNEAIQKAISDYLTQAKARDDALKTSLANDNRSAQTTGLQDEVNAAENVGDTALVSQLLPQLAGATVATQSLSPSSVLYNGANLGSYAPSNSLNVTATPTSASTSNATPVNSPLKVTKTAATPGY